MLSICPVAVAKAAERFVVDAWSWHAFLQHEVKAQAGAMQLAATGSGLAVLNLGDSATKPADLLAGTWLSISLPSDDKWEGSGPPTPAGASTDCVSDEMNNSHGFRPAQGWSICLCKI